MIASRAARLTLTAIWVVAASACAREKPAPAPKEFVFGARRVQVIVPDGWEALDQGKQKRFRKGEFSIVLQFLGPSTSLRPGPSTPPPGDLDELIDWGMAQLGAEIGPDKRRELKSRRLLSIDGREAFDIETWNRLDHTNPQRIFFVKVDGDLLALHTERMAFEDTLAAFDAIRDSLHLVSAER